MFEVPFFASVWNIKNLTILLYANSVIDWSNCFPVLVGDPGSSSSSKRAGEKQHVIFWQQQWNYKTNESLQLFPPVLRAIYVLDIYPPMSLSVMLTQTITKKNPNPTQTPAFPA